MSQFDGPILLQRIEEGIAGKTGAEFFRQIVRELSEALGAHAAFAGQLEDAETARMLAFWVGGGHQPCATYKLVGTPCAWVYEGLIQAFPRGICERFPVDREWFEAIGVDSYLGVPLKDDSGKVVGHMAVMDTRERDWQDVDIDILRLLSRRCAAEIERSRFEARLEEVNAELVAEIARRQAVEIELTAARLAAEEANHAKSVFVSNMSHELRTPLNGIIGYTQLLRRNEHLLDAMQRDGLDIIESSGQHLLALINDLLDLAKIESGTFEPQSDSLDFSKLLHEVGELTRMRAQSRGLDFIADIATDLPRYLLGDARALRQILLNLLGNAVKFTDSGGSVTLIAHPQCDDGDRVSVTLRVVDTGVGMAPEHVERIFVPFYRVVDTARPVEGNGLGLAICQRLVEAMEGQINVESAEGRGSTFTVSVPLLLGQAMSSVLPSRQVRGYLGKRRTVLVVDDDAVNRNLIERLLGDLGFTVHQAEDGATALVAIADQHPDLIITDMRMPGVDGLALVRALRSREDLAALPVIGLSASAQSVTAKQALDGGCDLFLSKPAQLDHLLDALQSLLDLVWVLADQDLVPSIPTPASDEFKPAAGLATRLHEFAQSGDVVSLLALADDTLGKEPGAATLHATLRGLAQQYEMREIRKILAPFLPAAASSG